MRITRNLWRAGLALACIFVRLIALNSDPPAWLSWSTGIWTDEGFYTLDARHEALFHTLAPGNFHDRLLSPVLSFLQQLVFSSLGVGLLQARLISVVFGLLTVFVFWVGLRRAYGTSIADWGALFLGLAPPFVFYNRLALQETPTVFWLTLAFTLWVYGITSGKRQIAWLASAGIAMAAAFVFKPLALLAIPALFAVYTVGLKSYAVGRGRLVSTYVDTKTKLRNILLSPRRGRLGASPHGVGLQSHALAGAGGLLFGLTVYAALWYLPHQIELTRMAAYYRIHQIQPHSWLSVWLNLRRGLIGGERGVVPYLFALLPVPCALAAVFFARRRFTSPADRFLEVWLVCGLAFCLLSSYAPSRYYVLFVPALAGLAARGMMSITRQPLQVTAIALFLITSALWFGNAWISKSGTRHEASKELAAALPAHSVMIGEFAPALCLDTRFAAAFVQPGLANDDKPVERLQATHIAVTRTAFWQNWWQVRYPDIVQPSHKVATVTLGGSRHYLVDIYAVKEVH